MQLHIFATEYHWIVAHAAEEARYLYCKMIGEKHGEGAYDDPWDDPATFVGEWEQLPDGQEKRLWVDGGRQLLECGYGENAHVETHSCAEWATHFGLGGVATSEC